MKKLLFAILSLGCLVWAGIITINAQNTEELLAKAGKIATVEGKVIDTAFSKTETACYLNFGDDYTKCFSVVIFSRHYKHFEKAGIKPVEFYKDQTVAVTGMIKNYNEHPEIIVTKPHQIKIIGEQQNETD